MLDPDRLRALFADPDLGWILDRLETRLRCGRPLSGGLTLRCPTPGQRSAVDRLLGRRPSRGQSLTLSLGTLEDVLRHGELAGDLRVHVCENPAVVAAAAHRLGSRCAPLVCLEGQPTTAARVLLERLRAAGCPLVYHGDFDWSGVRIANLVMARHAARPWRFRAADYLAVVRRRLDARPLEGRAVEAAWDADLAPAMARAGVAVFEEQVIEDLLADL